MFWALKTVYHFDVQLPIIPDPSRCDIINERLINTSNFVWSGDRKGVRRNKFSKLTRCADLLSSHQIPVLYKFRRKRFIFIFCRQKNTFWRDCILGLYNHASVGLIKEPIQKREQSRKKKDLLRSLNFTKK